METETKCVNCGCSTPVDVTQTATVSDEAVQAALDKWNSIPPFVDDAGKRRAMRRALTAAYPHLALSSAPCSVEVKKLEWIRPETVHESVTYFRADTVFGKYGAWGGGRAELNDVEINSDRGSIDLAKAAAQADFERRVLSQIATKPVDVAAVRRQAFEEVAAIVDRYPLLSQVSAHIRALSPAETVDQYSAADELRDLQQSILQSKTLADFNSVKKTVERLAAPTSKGGE